MSIKTCIMIKITFQDYIYFTSREENRNKITNPILHNIALQYALKNVTSQYRIKKLVPNYIDDFKKKKRDYYIYPAINIQSIGAKLFANSTSILFGWQSDQYRTFSEQTSTNMLQFSNVKCLDPENIFVSFVTSETMSFEELQQSIPKYIRSGKMQSKIKVDLIKLDFIEKENYTGSTNWWFNPNDFPKIYDMGNDYVGNYMHMLPNGLIGDVSFYKSINIIECKLGNITIKLPICKHLQRLE